MARKKKREKVPTTAPSGGGLGSLGELLGSHGLSASEPAPTKTSSHAATNTTTAKPGRVVIRKEKKGRRGKTVTTLTGHGLEAAAAEALAKRLRKALGCGSGLESDALVLQGDQREAVAKLLEGEGWKVRRG